MTQDKLHHVRRRLDRAAHNVLNRLLSIALVDEPFVTEIRTHYSNIPCFANLRCGLWYTPSASGTCYFKSTDGHTHHWDFSISRLNLHVIHEACEHNGVIIVDSTRRGKRFPDSLSKTVPIWCCVINRAIGRHRKMHSGANTTTAQSSTLVEMEEKNGEMKEWDTDLHLPVWIPDMEKSQIEEKLDEFVDKFIDSGVNLEIISQVMRRPLRCLWISPATRTLPDLELVDFTPLILVSASRVDYPVKTHAWTYIQGAGDDQQEWSMGLTPDLFWSNVDYLIEDRNDNDECVERVKEVVQRSQKASLQLQLSGSAHAMQINRAIASVDSRRKQISVTRVGALPLWIGSNAGLQDKPDELLRWMMEERATSSESAGIRALISCAFEQPDAFEMRWPELVKERDADEGDSSSSENDLQQDAQFRLLSVDVSDSKRDKARMQRNLDTVLRFTHRCLEEDKPLAILCPTGANESVALCIAIMCQFFDSANYTFIPDRGQLDNRDQALDKALIRRKLVYVQSHVPAAMPSRNLMKQLNRYFLS